MKIQIGENKQYLFIQYDGGRWGIDIEPGVRSFLPATLGYQGDIVVNGNILCLTYKDKKQQDKDYPWVLLLHVLENKLAGFSIDLAAQNIGRKVLNDFFSRVEALMNSV